MVRLEMYRKNELFISPCQNKFCTNKQKMKLETICPICVKGARMLGMLNFYRHGYWSGRIL